MERIGKLFQKNENHEILISFPKGFTSCELSVGDKLLEGDLLFNKETFKILRVIDLSKEFSCKVGSVINYLARINGEYVQADEVIAEKIEMSGLTTRKIFAGVDGILNTDAIEKGIVKILGEKEHIAERASFAAEVVNIDYLKGITLKKLTFQLMPYINNFQYKFKDEDIFVGRQNITNKLRLIKGGDSVYTVNDLDVSYEDSIVFAGKYMYPSLFEEIVKRGATCVLTNSMDYEDYLKIKSVGKLCVLSGFGHLNYDDSLKHLLRQLSLSSIVIDESYGGSLYFVGNENSRSMLNMLSENGLIKSLNGLLSERNDEINSTKEILVRIFDEQNYGEVGELIGFADDSEYVLIEMSGHENRVVLRRNIDII